ncbi:MAG: CoB--CoM heterodisulfide reductase iron-sulfur subunit B family protein [Desulfobacterales bacterium]|nr:CoB--CoM heterodisulfide reductase iron-sulfur subunit B family protein [Desulfobacterales bacterium]
MKLAYFPGCKISFFQAEYGEDFEAVMSALGVELVNLSFNCCGNPLRGEDLETSFYSALRNLALAREAGLDIITPCKCCFGQFKHAISHFHGNPEIRERLLARLRAERLYWDGKNKVRHLLDFLYHDIGVDALADLVKHPQTEESLVVQYGCHALRPMDVTRFDNAHAPRIFEELMAALGCEVLPWSRRTECCGNPAAELNPELARTIAEGKLESARKAGAHGIVTACTHCQMQYGEIPSNDGVEPLLFTRILRKALGI